ncbi:hypothetical protein [Candidatus Finniella inopinata]|uniref:Uncharacterized protein n=1 Tax=Candidatus Finniella inopinata TaxID=1696036 RepID=A0A4Q7DGS1_9PROT|nr:hypothetical protein [Candidatus Finniella inopinata]RZI45279.1 hypothetical protein EQU50_07770 [Candidatus Finniella inopinata]
MTQKTPLTSITLMEQLEGLYNLALSQDNLALALKVKELQAKSLGLFQQPDTPNLSTLSDENLKKLIGQLAGDLNTG